MTDENTIQTSNQPGGVFFYGRTLQEYVKMFDLDLSVCQKYKILDCPAGPASFVAEAHQEGLNVVGCDPMYTDDLEALIENGNFSIEKTIEVRSSYSHLLSQKFYASLESLKDYATLALKRFAEDYPLGREENRYIATSLPNLPFDNQSFDLVLSGNFLFIYSKLVNEKFKQFDYQFHQNAVLELLRVGREVRIFPIPCWSDQLNEYASKMITELEKDGIVAQILPVEYEVMKGGNLMLRLTR